MDIIISNSGGVPIYEQITRQMKGLILRGELKEGEALPSMRLLAKELRISVITTKRAYEELERDGFLENVPGKGCFVAPQNKELLREAQLRRVEEKLTQAIEEARRGAVSLEELKEHYRRGGLGDVTVKRFLNNVMQEELRPIRDRRKEWERRLPEVYEILRAGSERAEKTAAQTLRNVRRAMRIDYFENGNLLQP